MTRRYAPVVTDSVESHESRQRRRSLLGPVLVFALVVRVGWAWVQPDDPQAIGKLPDQREYLALADNLLHGNGLHFFDARFADEVYAFRTPGYPAFVAVCAAKPRVVRLAQAVIDTSTVLAIYLLARRWLTRGAAVVAAAIVALNPFLIYFSALVLSETLFAAMLAWGMVLLAGPRPGDLSDRRLADLGWIAGGAVLALGILVRPSGLGLPIVLGVAAAFVNPRLNPRLNPLPNPEGDVAYKDSSPQRTRWRWPVPVATTMLALTALVLIPWAARNYARLGAWIWTTTNAGITSYDGFNPDATGASHQEDFIRAMPQLKQMSEVDRDQYLQNLAKDAIRRDPRRALELAAAKISRTWSPVPLSREYSGRLYFMVGLLFSLPFDLLILAGLWSGRVPRSAKVFLLLPALYFTLVHAASVGSLRYRVVAEGPMAVLAAAAFMDLARFLIPSARFAAVPPYVRARSADTAATVPSAVPNEETPP